MLAALLEAREQKTRGMKAKKIRISIISINADRVDFGCRILDYGGFRAADFAEQWDCVFDFNFPIIYSACKGYAFSLSLSKITNLDGEKEQGETEKERKQNEQSKAKRNEKLWSLISSTFIIFFVWF